MADTDKYSYSRAYDLRQEGRFAEAFEIYRHFADLGEESGQYALGSMYYKGEGVEQDIRKAVEYLKAAAERGKELASRLLAEIYFYGENGEENYSEAIKYYEKCEEKLSAETHLRIGDVFYKGMGNVAQNYPLALKWYRQAKDLSEEYDDGDKVEGWYYTYHSCAAVPCTPAEAAQGRIDALMGIAFMYRSGKGVEANPKKALGYFVKAAKMGSSNACRIIGDIYFVGEGVEQDYEEAASWYKRVHSGYTYCRLAQMYLCGQGVPQEKDTAMDYYRLAIANGDRNAADEMEMVSSLDVSDTEALALAFFEMGKKYVGRFATSWYERAATLGHVGAMVKCAELYMVTGKADRAFVWCDKAIAKGSGEALHEKATYYRRGNGVPVNAPKAIELYKEAIAKGDKRAYVDISEMYRCGEGVPANIEEAIKWLKSGGENGHGMCYVDLGRLYYEGYHGIEPDFDMSAKYFDMAEALGCGYWAKIWRGFMEKARAKKQKN